MPKSKASSPTRRPPWAKDHTEEELEAARAKACESNASRDARDYEIPTPKVKAVGVRLGAKNTANISTASSCSRDLAQPSAFFPIAGAAITTS